MEAMARKSWTDERLDDLARQMHAGFFDVKAELRSFRAEMNTRFEAVDRRFEAVDRRFERVDERFERVDERFDRMQRLMIAAMLTFMTGVVAAFLGAAFT